MSRTFLPHVITDDSALGGAEIERSFRFNDNDSAYLQRQPSSNTSGSSQKITISFWIKIPSIPGYYQIFSRGTGYGGGGGASITLEDDLGGTDQVDIITMYGMAGDAGGNNGANNCPNINADQFMSQFDAEPNATRVNMTIRNSSNSTIDCGFISVNVNGDLA